MTDGHSAFRGPLDIGTGKGDATFVPKSQEKALHGLVGLGVEATVTVLGPANHAPGSGPRVALVRDVHDASGVSSGTP